MINKEEKEKIVREMFDKAHRIYYGSKIFDIPKDRLKWLMSKDLFITLCEVTHQNVSKEYILLDISVDLLWQEENVLELAIDWSN